MKPGRYILRATIPVPDSVLQDPQCTQPAARGVRDSRGYIWEKTFSSICRCQQCPALFCDSRFADNVAPSEIVGADEEKSDDIGGQEQSEDSGVSEGVQGAGEQ